MQREWGASIPELNIKEIIPQRHSIVLDKTNDKWEVVLDNPARYTPKTYRGLYAPILPALPEGYTTKQVFDILCSGKADDGPGRILSLNNGYISWHDVGPVYWLWNDSSSGGYITPGCYREHLMDMQMYGVLLQWTVVNEGK